MKNDQQEMNPKLPSSNTENPPSTAQPPANNNGQETSEPGHDVAADANGKRTSSRKIEANRRNARKSSGPKTVAGKKRVSKNAIKHGFFSKYLLVQHRDGKESQDEYYAFYAGVLKHYQPASWLEDLWVEKIAVWSWRLRRLLRGESGQIDRALAEHSYELQQAKADDLAEPGSASSSNQEMDALTDHLFLPEKEELDKVLRYEAMINRQLDHAMAELERVQARRKGEATASF